MAPARSIRTPTDHKNAVSPTQEHSAHFSGSCLKVLQNKRRTPINWCMEAIFEGGKCTWGTQGRHFVDIWETCGRCPPCVPNMSPKCPACVYPVSPNVSKMALTWHSLCTHLAQPNGTLVSPLKINKKNVPEHMLKESVLSIAPARSVRTPSDHKNAVSPTQEHSSHFSKSCPKVLQN